MILQFPIIFSGGMFRNGMLVTQSRSKCFRYAPILQETLPWKVFECI